MRKLVLLTGILLLFATFTYAQFTFTSIDYPGAVGTRARGINNHGQIVGSYEDENGYLHAYLFKKGKFIPLAPETSLGYYSDAFKINDLGDVVGWVCDDVTCHGFLYRKGVVKILDFPGATSTVAWDINNSGTVACVYDLFDSQWNFLYEGGCLWKDGNFTDVTYPGAADSAVTAIQASGDFAGSWDRGVGTQTSGFVFSKGEFTSFDAPFPDVSLTQPQGINAYGNIVGAGYVNGLPRGFLKVGANFMEIAYPGAAYGSAYGINNAGQMVGNWVDGTGTVHGWLAQPVE